MVYAWHLTCVLATTASYYYRETPEILITPYPFTSFFMHYFVSCILSFVRTQFALNFLFFYHVIFHLIDDESTNIRYVSKVKSKENYKL